MARPFSKRKQEIIRQKLIDKGRDAFSVLGLRKISINDLTQSAGISKGSFYTFFNSKEELYLEIVELEENHFREQVMAKIISKQFTTKDSIKNLIIEGLRAMETNPILRRMYEKNEFEQVLQALPPEKLKQHMQSDEDWLSQFIATWQDKGLIVKGDSKAIACAIRLIGSTSFFKDTIGGQSYPQALDLLADIFASGLAAKNQ